MTVRDLPAVPIRKRWRWARILVEEIVPGRRWPRTRRVGYWWTLIGGSRPVTVDGEAMAGVVGGPGRMSAYGSAMTAVLLMGVAMATVVLVPPPPSLTAFLAAFAAGRVTVHAQRGWPFGRRRGLVWVANVVRDPRCPPGAGAVVMDALCSWADGGDRPLALETPHPRLVSYYEDFGFACWGNVRKGQQRMLRQPRQRVG